MQKSMFKFGACALIAAIGLASCEKKEEAPKAPAIGGASGDVSSALDATKNAASDVSKQAADAWEKAKTSLMSEGESKLAAMGSSIEALKTRAAQVPAESKAAYDTTMKELTTQFDSVKSEFAKLKGSAQGSWDKVSADFQKSLSTLKETLDKAMKQFGAGA